MLDNIRLTPVTMIEEHSETKEEKQYDLTMGYYIVMGGFMARYIEYSDGGLTRIKAHPNGKSYTTLQPYEILHFLVRKGIFVRVERKAIEHKSKADVLAKFLVCFPVPWMVIELSHITWNNEFSL
jgi:hypothetical protein